MSKFSPLQTENTPSPQLTPINLLNDIKSLNTRLDKIVKTYYFKENLIDLSSFREVKSDIDGLFDHLQNYTFETSELSGITSLCRRLNEEEVIQKAWELLTMQDIGKEERFSHENSPTRSTRHSLTGKTIESLDRFPPYGTQSGSKPSSKLPRIMPKEDFSIDCYLQDEMSVEESDDVETGVTSSQNILEYNQKLFMTFLCLNSDENEIKKSSDISRLENLLGKIKSEYEDHKIDQAYKTLETIRLLGKYYANNTNLGEYYNSQLEQNKILITDVENDHKTVQEVLRNFEDDINYYTDSSKTGIITKYKSVSGGKTALKIEMSLDISFVKIISLLYEADSYMNWAPFCKESKELKKVSRAGHIAWLKWNLPPPISNREAYVIGKGYNRLEENGTFLITMNTIDENKCIHNRYDVDIPSKSGYVRMSIPYTGIELKPITNDRTEIRIAMMIDSKMKMIPTSIMGWMIRKGASHLQKVLTRASNKNDMSTKDAQEKNIEFYKWLNGLLDGFHKKEQS